MPCLMKLHEEAHVNHITAINSGFFPTCYALNSQNLLPNTRAVPSQEKKKKLS